MKRLLLFSSLIFALFPPTLPAQNVDSATLLHPPADSWPTYNGEYSGQRFSKLDQINSSNVNSLALAWASHFDFGAQSFAQQANEGRRIKASPLLVDGVLYFTITDNVWAIDARSGREIWHYAWPNNNAIHVANRGLGIYGSWLYFMTPDDYLVSLNAKDGTERWRVQIADVKQDFFSASAPLIIGNHVLVGPGNNDDIRAFLESRDPATGALQWRWWVDPDPGAPGSQTWSDNATMMKGGGFPWLNGTYDSELNLYYLGTGNGVPMDRPPHPTPDGDSLYTASIVALNPDTGKLVWAYQVTPHDTHDYDAAQMPILFDAEFNGKPRKLVAQISRNGYFFLLDRVTGEHLLTTKFMPQTNWAKGIDAQGRPIPDYTKDANPPGALVSPYPIGATNWWAPSYDPKLGLLYANAARTWAYFTTAGYGRFRFPPQYVTVAIDYKTGKVVWSHELGDQSAVLIAGLITTAGNLLFTGDSTGNFMALDPSTGKTLWHVGLGQYVTNAPITYMLDGRQYVLVAANDTFFAFALPEPPAGAGQSASAKHR
ncbi:acido-empty-quinoprotein group A [Paracidobacterium acidisoli]|uniref:Acido-empty-quinoprotein group A n=1 Tax=Paracidobacterium acidisoli TaxID=2303751 RepID=A0A372ILK7_9BACT|nr:acido-empty-quinoprotein group A [Paracidobacterium acidisoli]MBT9332389.1 acido-empty-quinoprotein group A [Paracidobacterium acidisoli]